MTGKGKKGKKGSSRGGARRGAGRKPSDDPAQRKTLERRKAINATREKEQRDAGVAFAAFRSPVPAVPVLPPDAAPAAVVPAVPVPLPGGVAGGGAVGDGEDDDVEEEDLTHGADIPDKDLVEELLPNASAEPGGIPEDLDGGCLTSGRLLTSTALNLGACCDTRCWTLTRGC